jgi:hypothetical protein
VKFVVTQPIYCSSQLKQRLKTICKIEVRCERMFPRIPRTLHGAQFENHWLDASCTWMNPCIRFLYLRRNQVRAPAGAGRHRESHLAMVIFGAAWFLSRCYFIHVLITENKAVTCAIFKTLVIFVYFINIVFGSSLGDLVLTHDTKMWRLNIHPIISWGDYWH